MRSPRFLRPHRVLIKNKIGEDEKDEAVYQTTTVNHVCVDASYGMRQSQKGIQPSGSCLIVFDMNDLVAFEGMQKRLYTDARAFEESKDKNTVFTLRPDDLICYRGSAYTIVEIADVNPQKDEPTFVEVIANEA